MKSMKIREATKCDVEIINHLFYELDTCSIEQQPEHFQRGERTSEYLYDIIGNENSTFLLCCIDDEIVGFSLIFLKETKGLSLLVPCKYAYIQDLVVSKKHRNNGYGEILLDASKQWAKDHHSDYLRLSVIPKNEDGIRFYRKNGLLEQMLTMECRIL